MKSFCIGVLAGSLLSLFLPIVPAFFTVFLLLMLTMWLLKSGRCFFAGAATFFICWIWHYDAYQQAQQSLLASEQLLTGTVLGSPKHYPEYSQFRLQLDAGAAKGYQVQLNWPMPAQLPQPGQQWQLSARLRPVAGVANPGGPHKEANALQQQVLAQGSVKTDIAAVLLNQRYSPRYHIVSHITQVTASLPTAPLLLALSVGERQFSTQLWQGLLQSSLAHLMAISGLHIGLIFGWGFWLLRLLPLPVAWSALRHPLSLAGALVLAFIYAWLAGFAVPTVRAAFALLLLVLALLQHKSLSYSHYWLLLTASLLLLEPFFVLSKSFWLSVLAVAVILFLLWQSRSKATGWRSKLMLFLRFQLSLTLFMALLSVLMFGGSSWLALLSNLLFVPWCSVVAIPLLFICVVAELLAISGAAWLWQLCDWAFRPLLWWLNWSAGQNSWWALPDLSWFVVAGLVVALALYWLTTRRLILCAVILLALPLCLQLVRPAQWQLHVIDVGQGLAVLLQHKTRGILYDAGPRYGEHSATAAQVLPYLRQAGIRHLDMVILSHDDSDHTGDWALLQRQYPEAHFYADIGHIGIAQPCAAVPQQYLGATLNMLHFDTNPLLAKNDRSCVLLITVAGWRLLLPGDIGRRVELQLLQRYPDLAADMLVLSHHGSNSSSHFSFLHQLAPVLALNSAGLYNRHQHPALAVQQRLDTLGIALLNTAQSGAIRLDIDAESVTVQQYRAQRIPFWLQKPVGNAETLLTTR
ncbi:DNA internalization-related competence protein ComEC/Rec2 [Rheinheimera sp.]|uniref:DNA internalization-related competence protein ComEC/Rec2 n=1 Tax=Rheinheimera sp. TaxID=1869214 RepID=UPI002735DFBF|nr:DNA internalization-related competence protein ComEC/Rec2 [Rheinheimera sp.]MDP2713648.1 DNA internalization-related competence protein ComEC/Rec2 [Rheinheimera sp.]